MHFSLVFSFLMLIVQNLIIHDLKSCLPQDSDSSSRVTTATYSPITYRADFPGSQYTPPTSNSVTTITTQLEARPATLLPSAVVTHRSERLISSSENDSLDIAPSK